MGKLWSLAAVAAILLAASASAADYLLYAGTFGGSGIYGYRLDVRTGKLKPLGLTAPIQNASFLIEHPDHRFLYATSEGGTISAFLIDPKSGKLALVNHASSVAGVPNYLALDRSGRWLAAASGGSVALFPLRKDGGVGEGRAVSLPTANAGTPHAVCVLFSPDNRFLLVSDQGLDRIVIYRFDAETGSVSPADQQFVPAAPGVGLGKLVFHPNGRVIYAVNETIPGAVAYHYAAADGTLDEFQTLALPPSRPGSGAAVEIAVNPSGTVVYSLSGGSDNMALLVVDPVRLTLSVLEYTPLVGRNPRYFALDPTGAYLAVPNLDSNNISLYSVHPHTGQLRPARSSPAIDRPACLVFAPAQ